MKSTTPRTGKNLMSIHHIQDRSTSHTEAGSTPSHKLDPSLTKSWILPFTKNMDPYNMDTSHTQKLDPPLTWFSVSLSFMTSLNLWRSPSRDRLPSSSLVQRFSASSRAIFRAFLFSSMRDSLAFSLAIFSCLTKTNLYYGI